MKTGRLHMRVDEKLLEKSRKLAHRKGMTLTHLVEAVLRSALEQDEQEKKTRMEAEQI